MKSASCEAPTVWPATRSDDDEAENEGLVIFRHRKAVCEHGVVNSDELSKRGWIGLTISSSSGVEYFVLHVSHRTGRSSRVAIRLACRDFPDLAKRWLSGRAALGARRRLGGLTSFGSRNLGSIHASELHRRRHVKALKPPWPWKKTVALTE